jgi:hypothetical protein
MLPAALPALLSDRGRPWKILLLAVVLIGLGAWMAWQNAHFSLGYWGCMEDPAPNDGRVVYLSLYRVVNVHDGGYSLQKFTEPVPVVGPSSDLRPGMVVSVQGHFDAKRAVIVEEVREVHRLRFLKYVLGFVGLVGLSAYFVQTLSWRGGRLVLRA